MNDGDIIELYVERSERAIEKSAEKYGAYCRSVAYGILRNSEDAEECVNDAYLSAWNSIPPHRPEKLSAYLGKLTRNHSINRAKLYSAEKRGGGQLAAALSELEECIEGGNTVEEAFEDKLLAESINRFLRSIGEEKRNVFIRRYWYLQSIREIADHYCMTESKVASLLFRLRRELKKHLTKEGIHI